MVPLGRRLEKLKDAYIKAHYSCHCCIKEEELTWRGRRIVGGQIPRAPGIAAFGMGGIEAARALGGLAAALRGGDLSNPATQRAVHANAATAAFQQFAQADAFRTLGQRYFGAGQAGELAFASFAQNMIHVWTVPVGQG